MEIGLIEIGLKQLLAWKICNYVDQIDKITTCSIGVGGNRSKERDGKSELVLRSTYQIFEWDRNNSDRNLYNSQI